MRNSNIYLALDNDHHKLRSDTHLHGTSCDFGDPTKQCCSGYCAASKCRSTDEKWPACSEDSGPCVVDEHCCYGNVCSGGICRRGQ
ncbi:hypothetical protein N7535_002168, partial [Penicillium sp. DV-2018c]